MCKIYRNCRVHFRKHCSPYSGFNNSKICMKPNFLILCAGKSERFGFPKPLLVIRGKTLLQFQIQKIQEAGYNKITVVVGYHKEKILQELKKLPVQISINFHAERGMFSSIQTGLRSINNSINKNLPVFIQPIDCLVPCSETLHKLECNLEQVDAVMPEYKSKSGHPLLISFNVQKEIIKSQTNYRLDMLLREKFFNKVKKVNVNDSCVISNINYLQDLERWKWKISHEVANPTRVHKTRVGFILQTNHFKQ